MKNDITTIFNDRLSPEQFKALVRFKGWKYTTLAERWMCSSVWVSNIARDPKRAVHYDDAVRGLPNLKRQGRDRARFARDLDLAMGCAAAKAAAVIANKPLGPGYRYRNYMVLGAIVAASNQVGSVAEEGMRGTIFQVLDSGIEETYGVIFETGLWDWFTPRYVDDYLVTTGLTDAANVGYRYLDELALQADFESGCFSFWPAIE